MKKQFASIQRFAALAVAGSGLLAFSMTSSITSANASAPPHCVNCDSYANCIYGNVDSGYNSCEIDYGAPDPCTESGGEC